MKMPPRQDTGRFLGDGLDSDWDSASLRSGLSDDEDDTVSLLHQLEGQLEAPAFDHRIPYSDDVSIAASDTRDEDHDIVGEVSDRMIGLCPPPAGHPWDRHWCLRPYSIWRTRIWIRVGFSETVHSVRESGFANPVLTRIH